MEISFIDLKKQYTTLKEEIDAAIQRVIDQCAFISGQEVTDFESHFAKACGARYCISVGNGTDALFIALKSMGIGPGDEVITVANTYFATAEAIAMTGATPVFVDCSAATFNMDTDLLERCLAQRAGKGESRVKAILPVHLYGRAADMATISRLAAKYKVRVIEDCAQAHLALADGKRAGTCGDAGCFSFYPSKNLGAFGDGGAIVTDNQDLAQRMRMFADHGQLSRYDHKFPGVNSRLDGLQAAILNVKLKHLAEWSRARYQAALLYAKYLQGVDGVVIPEIPAEGSHVFHLYVVRVAKREALMERLHGKGVPTIVHYPTALPFLEAFAHLGYTKEDLPNASVLQNEVLSLPLYPEISEEEVKFICQAFKEALLEIGSGVS